MKVPHWRGHPGADKNIPDAFCLEGLWQQQLFFDRQYDWLHPDCAPTSAVSEDTGSITSSNNTLIVRRNFAVQVVQVSSHRGQATQYTSGHSPQNAQRNMKSKLDEGRRSALADHLDCVSAVVGLLGAREQFVIRQHNRTEGDRRRQIESSIGRGKSSARE